MGFPGRCGTFDPGPSHLDGVTVGTAKERETMDNDFSEKLVRLRNAGTITSAGFEAQKAKLLA
jgi:hypothetical protein